MGPARGAGRENGSVNMCRTQGTEDGSDYSTGQKRGEREDRAVLMKLGSVS